MVELTATPAAGWLLHCVVWRCKWDEQPGDGDDGWEQECHRQLQCGGHGSGSPIWNVDLMGWLVPLDRVGKCDLVSAGSVPER